MATYLMLGKYSLEGLKGASSQRTAYAKSQVEKLGGKIEALFALLGEYDLVIRAQFPDNDTAMKASVALSRSTGIGFTTMPAMPVESFDEMLSKL